MINSKKKQFKKSQEQNCFGNAKNSAFRILESLNYCILFV